MNKSIEMPIDFKHIAEINDYLKDPDLKFFINKAETVNPMERYLVERRAEVLFRIKLVGKWK